MPREFFREEGLAGVLDTLKQLPPEVVSKAGGPVKTALKKAAELLRDEAKANLRAIIAQPNAEGSEDKSTGLLEQNVVATRGVMRGAKGERFLVRVRKKSYKVSKDATPVTTPQVARLLEYGNDRRRPMSWLRTAFDAKRQAAVSLFTTEVTQRTAAIVKRLERKARRK